MSSQREVGGEIRMREMKWSEARDALADEYGELATMVPRLTEEDLMAPSGCRGWTNADLIFHMLLDAQRALVTFNSPSGGPPDKDYVSYWEGFQASDKSAQDHSRFVRLSASAHLSPMTIARRWEETARAAIRNSESTSGSDFVTTQGHVMRMADFIATLVVEATIHHLDLLTSVEGPRPAQSALAITTRTLDGLLRVARPDEWDDLTYIRKLTGRETLSQRDRQALGGSAAKVPVFS